MRKLSALLPACAVAALFVVSTASSASAQGRAQIGGFGGYTFGSTTAATTFGGNLRMPLAGGMDIVAEVGRLDDVMPSTLGTLIDFTPIDLRLSAWYGEAGIRFQAPGHRTVTPYAEATAGFARMHTGFSGAGRADPFVSAALRFLDRTEPLLGVGAGISVSGGPLTLDLGYRYKRIMASDSLQSVLVAGDRIDVSQVRIGVGVRF
jgi:opacity protein-like surface antigen